MTADIGTGHARRCAVLAEALVEQGANIVFAGQSCTIAFAQELMPNGCTFIEIAGSPESLVLAIEDVKADCVIVDRYDLGIETERAISRQVKCLTVVDDFAGRPHHCDILIDQNLGRTVSDWSDSLRSETLILAGGAYALLRPEFANMRSAHSSQGAARRDNAHVFICFGGADPKGVTAWALPVMEGLLALGCRIDVAVGGETRCLEELQTFARAHSGLRIHVESDQVAQLMVKAHIAIGAPGSMTLERACLGIAQILVSFADNQVDVGARADSQGIALYLGDWRNVTSQSLLAAARELLDDKPRAEAMSARALSFVDGRGARRSACNILPETDKQQRPVRLRPMKETDIETVFAWQNSEGMRQYSLDPREITWNEHEAWSKRRLQSFPLETYMAVDGARTPVGLVHLSPADAGGWMVSLLVAREAQGHGIGRAILRQLNRIYADQSLFAVIKRENTASIKTFESAGYTDMGEMFLRRPRVAAFNEEPV